MSGFGGAYAPPKPDMKDYCFLISPCQMDTARTATRRITQGQLPKRVYQVRPPRIGTSIVITFCSDTSVRWYTLPWSSTNAENPVGETWTTHRPFSTARSLLDAICWLCSTVPV